MGGKTIRIYLADGTPLGIRHAELVNWSGQAIVCPRGRVGELAVWAECQRPGVYLLVGEDENAAREMIYIGEAENVFSRLQDHLKKKEFWTRVVFFTSKDDNLTKVHVKYLESRIHQLALEANRANIENATNPQLPSLPRPDRVAMEEFLEPVRILLGALGFPYLQPIAPRLGSATTSGPSDADLYFNPSKRVIDGRGTQTDDGFVVYAGSIGDREVQSYLGKGYREQREALLSDGSLVDDGKVVRFVRDVQFTSPSAAAAVLAGGAINGREVWRDKSGTSLKALEDAIATQSVSAEKTVKLDSES